MAGTYKQAGRLLQFTSPAGSDVLLADSIDGVEGVSRLYSFHIELLAEKGATVTPASLVGNKATLALTLLDTQGTRYFNGLVASLEQLPGVIDFDRYAVRLVPSLWQLTLSTNCRVFQGKTVMEIIKAVISPYALSVGDVTSFAYQAMDYCTQFNETDFNFISRLAEQFGIFYWFEHTENDNKVIFGDALSAYGECPVFSKIPFMSSEHSNQSMYQSFVSDLRATSSMITGMHTAYNWDFRTFQVGKLPSVNSGQTTGHNALERYTWPAGDSGMTKLTEKAVGTPNHGALFVSAQKDASDVNAVVYHGVSTARSLTAGYTFTVTDHPRSDWNQGYYLTEVAHQATQLPPWQSDAHPEEQPYRNHFIGIKSDQLYRPEFRTPKPKMYGPQNAIVVTPDGEENYIDKYGRVNVRFIWDRTASLHGTDNTWVRVAQPWAGPRTGAYFWPRLDDEVLIQFVDGDPDDPILIGSVYNVNAMPKYTLPDMSTRTGIYTRSLKGGGAANANELRFEDKTGSEQIFINAEKDLDLMVENDRRTHVKGQDSLIVDKNQLEQVSGSYVRSVSGNTIESYGGTHDVTITGKVTHKMGAGQTLDLTGDSAAKVDGKQGLEVTGAVAHKYGDSLSLSVSQNHGEKVGMNYALEAGMEAYIKGGLNVIVEAGMQLTLKGPGGFITIGPTGVAISGTMVLINSGGAADSGTAPNILDPAAPDKPQDPAAPDKADDGTKGGKM